MIEQGDNVVALGTLTGRAKKAGKTENGPTCSNTSGESRVFSGNASVCGGFSRNDENARQVIGNKQARRQRRGLFICLVRESILDCSCHGATMLSISLKRWRSVWCS